MKVHLFFILLYLGFFFGCQPRENERKILQDEPLFLAVRMYGEEGKDFINCLLQVQTINNSAIRSLSPGDSVWIDSILLQPDSARYSGKFYQAEFPADQFSGSHTIRFSSADGRTHTDSFEFSLFSLKNEPGAALAGGDISLYLNNFPRGESKVNLLITDTSYASNDINIISPVKDGQLSISQVELSALKKGPIVMQVIFEDEIKLQLGKTRGKLLVSYGLTREFILQ